MRDAARKVGDEVVNQCQFTTQGTRRLVLKKTVFLRGRVR